MNDTIFAPDAKFEPYWWEAAPRPSLPGVALPKSVDVAVVGSGFTGLAAALTLARAGRNVIVFEASDPGFGASSRNGGMVGAHLKGSVFDLIERFGQERALALLTEAQVAREHVAHFVESEQIECHFRRTGMFVGAHRPSHYEEMARELELLKKEIGYEGEMVPRAEQHREIGTDLYHGGRVNLRNAGLHPALYHQGLLERVLAAGAAVAARTPVGGIAKEGRGFVVATPRGKVKAGDVIVATNGYTGSVTPDFRRRVIPIGSYIIATEPLDATVMQRLMPKGRMLSDTKRILYYYRPSPDGTRILFGGRAAVNETDVRASGRRLHRFMTRIYPELASVKITHSWTGFVAFTFDKLPHTGVRDGIHYAMGYCGSGVAMATYLGHKTALRVLGLPEAATPLESLEFPTRPFYTGNPWFLPLVAFCYRWADRLAR
ncbi:MAG: NAD(P)/FAD-dependent oxidoreductase [Alphaproteobacteria bacterium]